MTTRPFPDDFCWGAATSAPQIEGGRRAGGRGESIWDVFADTPGTIRDGSTPETGCDHYHRWREDLELLKGLGVGAYRFSIAWPRVLPQGVGAVNEKGLDFYDALVDALLESGIEPYPTLYHWDLPQALQERGGWADRGIVGAFVAYAEAVARRLGDRVTRWTTLNEPWCVASLGHEQGLHAPGHRDPAESLAVAHHLLLAHGRAAWAIRRDVIGGEVGLVNNHCPVHAATDTEADRDAARRLDGSFNRWYLDPIFKGAYPEDAVADRIAAGHLPGPDLPFVRDGDLETIAAPLDFLGVNYYSRAVVEAGEDGGPKAVEAAPDTEVTTMGWEVYPEGLYESLAEIHRVYAPPRLYVTENGSAWDDPPEVDGRIRDDRRIAYFDAHLEQVRRAVADGIPLAGYFAWSLLDNFEWGFGYAQRFGLVAVDRETGRRIPKDSYAWYRDAVAAAGPRDASSSSTRGEPRAIEP